MRKQRRSAEPVQHLPLVVVSDAHLGMRGAGAELLLEFLQHTRCDTLILNGDIIDGERIKRGTRDLPETHIRVLDEINKKIGQDGTRVVYIPGNHDIDVRKPEWHGIKLLGIEVHREYAFDAPDGRKLLMTHGDIAEKGSDADINWPRWFRHLAEDVGVGLISLSKVFDRAARCVGMKGPRIFAHLHRWTETVSGTKKAFEKAARKHALDGGFDGIVCGHTHFAELKTHKDGFMYANSGDWVESFTALSMNAQGQWAQIDWLKQRRQLGLKGPVDCDIAKKYRHKTRRVLQAFRRLWPTLPRLKRHKPKPRH
ncbi:MAG: UDP-2,3-diacylglucosamine diphosphatase [Alphaproteobacteria bacterium]|nr:UDP-2,3-diacylglucosamine diphosphatase [Alphaproteobacteria bacterium]